MAFPWCQLNRRDPGLLAGELLSTRDGPPGPAVRERLRSGQLRRAGCIDDRRWRTARGSLPDTGLRKPRPGCYFGRVNEPIATRRYMPGYGTLPASEGSGLLPWSWAEKRLRRSHDFWLATVTPEGVPHLMPVWAVWHERRLWFSSANRSRKARNLGSEPRCTVSTENPLEPVVVQGRAQRVTDRDAPTAMLEPRTQSTEPPTAWTWSTPRQAASSACCRSGYSPWTPATSPGLRHGSPLARRRPGPGQLGDALAYLAEA
jgi:nitroimidazol reductase NimA-like FMN-containing flavoprotein (pyridoxamine 5'-phosphate oxidase superfamily)